MKAAFADAGYWIALLHARDRLHRKAQELSSSLEDRRIVTTELILIEVLNDFSGRGEHLRRVAWELVDELQSDEKFIIVAHTPELFQSALARYRSRPDKRWSFTDCASFIIMEEQAIQDALAYDAHFEQAGFRALLR